MSHRAERQAMLEARRQQQQRYERDLTQFKARERERERERRERWLARHRVLGSPGRGSGTPLGYRLNGNPRCGSTSPGLGHGLGARTGGAASASASFASSSAFSTASSRGSKGLTNALVPWVQTVSECHLPSARPSVESAGAPWRKPSHAEGGQTRPPEARGSPLAQQAQPQAGPPPDVGAVRLAYKMKQENMEYERRRQRMSRVHDAAGSARRRIPKNDPGHRLGRALRPGEGADAVLGAAAMAGGGGGGARFRPARTTVRAAHRTAVDAHPEPTITLPDDGDDASTNTNRGSPYILSASGTSSYTIPQCPTKPPMRFTVPPRAARSPTVARNTPAASTTSTPRATTAAAVPPPPPTRTLPTYRAFAVPRSVGPPHNCGTDHTPRPHRQAPGTRGRTTRPAFAAKRPLAFGVSAEPGCGPAKANRAAPTDTTNAVRHSAVAVAPFPVSTTATLSAAPPAAARTLPTRTPTSVRRGLVHGRPSAQTRPWRTTPFKSPPLAPGSRLTGGTAASPAKRRVAPTMLRVKVPKATTRAWR